jgi:hypothetical protein
VITRAEEADLRDAWCVVLLERTSSVAALCRARAAERDGWPAYDAVPERFALVCPRPVQPRDVLARCALAGCARWFKAATRGHQRFCSALCRRRAATRRRYARLLARTAQEVA